MGNKVRFNLCNVHYAKLTELDGTETFGTPVHIPGAVSLSLSPEGDTTPFFADGVKYYVSVANNGYTGDLEMALIPDSFRKEILGEAEDTEDKVLVENANTTPSQFALLFQFDGDQKGVRHVLYSCTASRPNLEAATTTTSKEPATETLSFSAVPLLDGSVKAKTGDDTTATVYQGWFTSVWRPSVPGGV